MILGIEIQPGFEPGSSSKFRSDALTNEATRALALASFFVQGQTEIWPEFEPGPSFF